MLRLPLVICDAARSFVAPRPAQSSDALASYELRCLRSAHPLDDRYCSLGLAGRAVRCCSAAPVGAAP